MSKSAALYEEANMLVLFANILKESLSYELGM